MKSGDVVQPVYAYDLKTLHGDPCVIRGSYDCPTFTLVDAYGKDFTWPQHMCKEVPLDQERSYWVTRESQLKAEIEKLRTENKRLSTLIESALGDVVGDSGVALLSRFR